MALRPFSRSQLRALALLLVILTLPGCGSASGQQASPASRSAATSRSVTTSRSVATLPPTTAATAASTAATDPPPPDSLPYPGPGPEQPGCDPNYTGDCVPIASDVDCAGGRGNGPEYVAGPVEVIGADIYGLDRDGDGVGCE